MEFTQIGKVSSKQKAAVKASRKFNSFLWEAKNMGANEIILISVTHENWIELYAKTPDLQCNYWVTVGPRGGLADEAYKTYK